MKPRGKEYEITLSRLINTGDLKETSFRVPQETPWIVLLSILREESKRSLHAAEGFTLQHGAWLYCTDYPTDSPLPWCKLHDEGSFQIMRERASTVGKTVCIIHVSGDEQHHVAQRIRPLAVGNFLTSVPVR